MGGRENPPAWSCRGYDVAIGGTENDDACATVVNRIIASRGAMAWDLFICKDKDMLLQELRGCGCLRSFRLIAMIFSEVGG